jgi:ABC-type dipeptide transport system, periplasmic component
MPKRSPLVALLAALAALLLLPAFATAQGAGSSEPLVVVSGAGNSATVRNFNPFSQTAMFCNANCAYEPLMIINGITGEIVPWLATEYEFSADATRLTLKLRQGVRWSDGEPFTADDVVFTFTMLRDNPGFQHPAANAMAPQTGYVDSVRALDSHTVEFTFKRPFSLAIYDLLETNIVPEHIWAQIENPAAYTNESPVGTGPFTEIVNFTPEQYEVHRNPYYWQADKVRFGGFKVIQGLSADAQSLAIINGQYDWTGAPIPDLDAVYVSKDPQNRGYFFPQTANGVGLLLMTEKAPFNDANVRKAISMAIDRELIVDIAMMGYTKPADVTGLSDYFASWKVENPRSLGTWTEYNVAEANRLLDAAGLRMQRGVRVLADGTPMEYRLAVVGHFLNQVTAADIIVQNLAAIGIRATVTPMSFGELFQALMVGNFDMALFCTGGNTPYAFYRSQMSATTYAPAGQPAFFGNYVRYVNSEADALLARWAGTINPAEQREIAQQLQRLYAENAPAIPLYYQPSWLIYKTDRFTGFPTAENPYAIGSPDSNNTNMLLVITQLRPR